MGRINLDDSGCVYDERLARRMKRKKLDIRGFELNTCRRRLKRALEDNQLGDGMIDEDYGTFLSHLGEWSESRRSEGGDDDDGDEEDDMDPQYKMFLENLHEDGNSYVLEVRENERPVFIKYEVEGRSEDEREPETPRKSRDVSKRKEMERRNSVIRKDSKSLPQTPVSRETNGCLSPKPSAKDNPFSEPEHEREMVDGTIDESYQAFLNCIKQEGDCLVFVTKDGKWVKYEEDDAENSSDSEILVTDNAPYCDEGTYNPFVTSRIFDSSMEGDDWQCLGSPSKSTHSQFREKVMGILRRPYDQKEYEELLQEINDRKPMEGHRDLRGRIKSYSAEKCSKSYLDHHNDLKKKIDAARTDRRKVLNLLRGFFYWLQNLSHEGAFRPWLDTSCLAVMPRNR